MFKNSEDWTKRIAILFLVLFLGISVIALVAGIGLLKENRYLVEAHLLIICSVFLALAALLTVPLYTIGKFVKDFCILYEKLGNTKNKK